METGSQSFIFLSLLYFSSIVTLPSSATNTIFSGQSLGSNHTLISEGGNFELGIFQPGKSSNYYIGVWYKKISVDNRTIVWVANRNSPLIDPTSSELKLLENGNLVLLNQSNIAVWSTNATSDALNSSQAVLGDDGNLVIRNGRTLSEVLWQSFDYPTDTILPGGKIRYDYRTQTPQRITSWRGTDDPSEGLYSLMQDGVTNDAQLVVEWNRNSTYWRSGSWNGQIFQNIPKMRLNNIYNFSYFINENESYFTYTVYNASLFYRFVTDEWGQVKMLTWDEKNGQWFLVWSFPRRKCSVYGYCGFFSVCENGNCRCLDDFIPQSANDSYTSGYFSGNCVKDNILRCEKNDTFSLISNMGTPIGQMLLEVSSADECKLVCLNRCPCSAYSYSDVCSIWTENLRVTEVYGGQQEMYLRLAASKEKRSSIAASKGKRANIFAIAGSVAGVLFLGLIITIIYLKKRPKSKGSIALTNESHDQLELPLFNFAAIAAATDEFSLSNKIGQGGFGPVYKGILPSGEEIAIKRLSKDSRQGLQEFMNEVILIAKLQHRNLVRLLGCCIQGDDRMLIYEYMPNKSLDFFIFDKSRGANLNWNERFDIIVGIARGLLYLHRDSRLRIIHRDLKAANILLDSEMNPKISDFGMARTFVANQTEENTMRVVGTYGYMSPEYATEGLFSMKSDIFSFGVILLEIVSGKRNRGFHHTDHDLNLLGHAWTLLKDNRALEIMDASIKDSFTFDEVFKCIQVGLLCVQKFPEDRPSMSTVLSMLDGDGTNLPYPKQPGFYTERDPFQQDSSCSQDNIFTKNEATITLPEGR